jgi:anti-sigma regulatory factor (Ser/Thr protein kinase)
MIQDRRFADIARYDTREGAVSAVRAARVHPVRRVSAHLAPTPAAPGTARELVEGACRSWGVGYLAGPATVVVSELVSNAVQHAGTDLKVIVALRGGYLHVSVQDGSPDPPMVTDLGARGGALVPERGRGLHLIKGYAVAWGSTPTDGGKTVWATLRVAPS